MPPKAKKAAPPAAAPNGKPAAAASPKPEEISHDDTEVKTLAGGKPDQAAFHAEQDKIKADIEAVQVKLNAVKEKIASVGKNGPGNDRRNAIRAEMDSIRAQQSTGKLGRGKLLDQMKAIQEGVQKRGNDLKAARAKNPYKTVAEVDAQVKHLEKQIESGTLKLGDEKRALQEMSTLKRSRKTVEGFQAEQEAIDADRARADELYKQLNDPEAKAISERYEALKEELDEIKKQGDEVYAGRNKLFEERNTLSEELNVLYGRKRESSSKYKEASDRYWSKVQEERARRAERLKAQRQAEEDAKRQEQAEHILEEARAPAFQSKIEDCQTLIDYFNAKLAGGSAPIPEPKSLSSQKPTDVAGVPKLEIRQVEPLGEGLVQRKKKGQDEESYFVGGKGKGKKGGKPAQPAATNTSTALNIPFATLSALLDLSIPPPASTTDLPRAVEDLKTKKAWYEANQARVTAENIAKAEAQIKKLTGSANGHVEVPGEPHSTPAEGAAPGGVAPDAVDEQLESVKETDEAPAAVEATA
ncbi:hypothetical protein M422DRAFT_57342 [Sphaerobolus stellatus SS14]|nr:hypothetical protein M422DRAFT_57342 [Sphaerobolus stellatus SS14]